MSVETDRVDLVGDEVVGNVARAALFAAMVGAFAYVKFPNPLAPGVPFTLQVLGVFLAGLFLGGVWGAASMGLLLVAGAAGAPVFANGSGLGYFLGPTGGFLLSYPVAAGLVGLLVHGVGPPGEQDDAGVVRLVGAMVLATVVIYAFGMAWFAWVQAVPLGRALVVVVLPFVPAEAVKIAAAVGIARSDAITAR